MRRKPLKVGLLALTLDFYERTDPSIRQQREQWVRRDILPALSKNADVEL